MISLELIGVRIKQLIDNKGISQNDLAKKIGTSSSQITNIIQGKPYGLEFLLNIISNYPEISAEWLLKGQGEMILGEENQSIYKPNDTKFENYIKKNYKVKGDSNAVGENTATYGREAELMKEIEFLKEKNKLLESQLEHSNNQISFLQNVITKFS